MLKKLPYKAIVTVRYKKSVLEPQGQAALLALHSHNYKNILDIRIGKSIELSLEAFNREEALKKIHEIVDLLLCNPVIELYDINLKAVE